MSEINIRDIFNNLDFQKAQLSIHGEAAHRLNQILIFKLNNTGSFTNKIICDQQKFTKLMGYSNISSFKKARKALVNQHIWEYHNSNKINGNGIESGYFSLPQKFLSNTNLNSVYRERYSLVPASFYINEKYRSMSSDAKWMYIYFNIISLQNNSIDDEGKIYFTCTNTALDVILGFKKDKAIRVKKELETYGLLRQVRQGCKKSNRLYLTYMNSIEI